MGTKGKNFYTLGDENELRKHLLLNDDVPDMIPLENFENSESENDYYLKRGRKYHRNSEDFIFVDTKNWRVRRIDLVFLNAAWVGLSCVLVAWGVVMLPSQVRSTVGNDRAGTGLAAIVVVGSVLTIFLTPFIGILSDRSSFSFGRRRPFMILGLVWVVLAQIFLGLSNPHKPSQSSTGCNYTETTYPSGDGDQDIDPDEEQLHGHLWLLIVIYAFATIGYQVYRQALLLSPKENFIFILYFIFLFLYIF